MTKPELDFMDGPMVLSSSFALAGKKLEHHKRLVALAAVREGICQQVQLLEEQKVQLSQQKMAEQQRLLHALKMRLEMAQGSLDGQLGELHSKCRAVETQMEAYGRLLRGTEAEPAAEKWQQMEAQFQRLQQHEQLMLDAEDFKAQLGLLRVSGVATNDVAPLKKELTDLKVKHEECTRELVSSRAESRAAHERVAELLAELREAKACRADAKQDIGREVRAVREQYEYALELMRKEQEREVKQLKSRVAQLTEELEELHTYAPFLSASTVAVSPQSVEMPDSLKPPIRRGEYGSIRMLREALGTGQSRAADASEEVPASGQQQKRNYIQRLLLDIQARSIEERQKMDTQHQQDMQKQALAHEEAMRGLVASHEEAMGRLTKLLEGASESKSLAQLQRQSAAEIDSLRRELEAAQESMESMREDHESRLGYELYKERVAHQKELTQLKDAFETSTAEELETARKRIRELEVEVNAARGPEGSSSREELEAELEQLKRGFESEVRSVAEQLCAEQLARADAEAIRLREAYETEISSLKEEHRVVLTRRDAEIAEVLSELKVLREQHFASSSSEGQARVPRCQSPTASASVSVSQRQPHKTGDEELSFADMGSDSLLTLSPSSASSHPQRCPSASVHRQAAQSHQAQSSGRPDERFPSSKDGPNYSNSPAESAASSGRPETRADNNQPRPTAMGMSSLVAAVLGGRREEQPSTSPANASEQVNRNTAHSRAGDETASTRCVRCGETESSSPGACRFHPFLVKAPAPFLYGPEWHLCKAAGHTSAQPGCYVRTEHYFATGIADSLAAAGPRRNLVHSGIPRLNDSDAPPQPRTGGNLPAPTPLSPRR